MMKEYNRYDQYKDSGIKIIGEIPRGWNLNRIKYNNIINPNKSELSYKKIDVSFIPMEYIKDGFIENKDVKNIDEVYNGYTYFKEGDILLAKVTPCFENGNLGIAKNLKNGIGFGTTEVHVIRAKKDNKKFIYYLFQNKHFKEKGKSEMYGAGGLKRIPSDFVENYIYPRPDYQTQICISNYLDQKTTEIDEIINKKEKLIDYLEKYKKSVITEAVTKGKLGDKYINEDGELVDEIEMKDSGVEWLGKIPEYWGLIRLKFLAKIKNGKKQDKVETENGEYPILGSGGEFSRASDYLYDKPSVLLGRKGTIDKPQYIEEPFWTVDTLFYTEIKKIILSKLFFYLTKTIRFDYYSTQTALPSMTQEDLNQIPFPLAIETKIQEKIVSFIKDKITHINYLIQKTKESIQKYKEYKKSLIFEAVTGKIDLRDYELEGGEELAEHNNSSETERESISAVD